MRLGELSACERSEGGSLCNGGGDGRQTACTTLISRGDRCDDDEDETSQLTRIKRGATRVTHTLLNDSYDEYLFVQLDSPRCISYDDAIDERDKVRLRDRVSNRDLCSIIKTGQRRRVEPTGMYLTDSGAQRRHGSSLARMEIVLVQINPLRRVHKVG